MKKILIVEDEILIQHSLKKLLEKKSAQVDVSSSGKLAIDLMIKNNYDRVVCDLMLQDISGFDVIEEAKRKYTQKQISQLFIIMTAYNSQEVLSRAQTYGCRLLNKPFNNLELAIKTMME